MKTLKYFVFLLLLTVITIYSCKKDELSDPPFDVMALEEDYPPIISGNGIYDEDTIITPTILGAIRVNPYTVEVMKESWNNLNPSHQINTLAPTDLYVRFTPASVEEAKLVEQTGEMLYDYPLLNEIVSLGDYYPQPGRQFPELWAIVPPNFQSPIEGYTILSELFIPRFNTYLTQEAFGITGNTYDNEGEPMYIQSGNDIQSLVTPKPPDGGDGGPGGGGGGDPNLTTNSCGCLVYSNIRKPGGCIKVRDTQFSGTAAWPGVRKVKVIMKDTWFTEDETYTDHNGCWKINNDYYGNAWMWVKFNGEMGQIRSNRGFGSNNPLAPLYEWLFPVKDYKGKVRTGPPFNNIEVKYDIWVNRGSSAHIHWGAATVNNAWHEFNEYSSLEGINPVPSIDILLGHSHTGGYTLMQSQATVVSYGIIITSWAWLLGPWGIIIQTLGIAALIEYLPDMYIGIDYMNSDRLKYLCYHEMTHASHFTKAGPFFWDNLLNATIINLGHGSNGSPGSGILGLCESWAISIGYNFTHKRYGGNNSINFDWDVRNETSRNETASHIPIGLYHDLIDANIDVNDACDRDQLDRCPPLGGGICCGPISDFVNGFTLSQMFSLLNSSTNSPSEFVSKLKTQFLNQTNNTAQQVDDLFLSY